MRKHRTLITVLLAVVGMSLGCASANVNVSKTPSEDIPRPNKILVYDFAVTPTDVTLDRGISPKVARGSGSDAQTAEEIKVGNAVAEAISKALVKELEKAGIVAQRAADYTGESTDGTAEIHGQFLSIDQGDRTKRAVVGFGLGGSEIRTRVEGYTWVGGKRLMTSEAYTSTKSSLKPGMLLSGGIAIATGGAAVPLGVGGAAAIGNEAFGVIKADARNTAKEIAKVIRQYYVRRGWLSK